MDGRALSHYSYICCSCSSFIFNLLNQFFDMGVFALDHGIRYFKFFFFLKNKEVENDILKKNFELCIRTGMENLNFLGFHWTKSLFLCLLYLGSA